MKHVRSWIKTGVVVLAAFAGGATVSWAHGGDGSLVHACYAAVGQPLIASDASGGGCANAANRIDWAITGPAGPAGAAGAPGPAGPAGPAGSDANAKPQFTVTSWTTKSDIDSTKSGVAVCPTGTFALSGGWNTSGFILSRNAVLTSSPTTKSGKSGWYVNVSNYPGIGEKGEPWKLQVIAVCQGTPEGIDLPPKLPVVVKK